MADYYPLIARAVAGLDPNTGEIRRALYERARTALVAQLRNSDPPLEEADITAERLALEDAIRRIEADTAVRPAVAGTTADAVSSEPATGAAAASALPASEDAGKGDKTKNEKPGRDKPESGTTATGRRDARSAATAGVSGVLGQAEELGEASARSVRSARDNYDAIPSDDASVADDQADDRLIGRAPPPAYQDGAEEAYPRLRSYSGFIKAGIAILLGVLVLGLGFWQRDTITSLFDSGEQPTQQTAQTAPGNATKPKIADRVAPGGEDQQPSTAPALNAAQKAILYEEDPNDSQGKRYVGSVLWRTETVSPGPGLAPELAIRADVEVPERRLRMTWSLRRNADKTLPASHTIEIMFNVPADFSDGGIANVPGVLMKSGEQTRGTPLAGLAVKVTAGYFLIGLSATDAEMQRNLQLLKERPWFDIPVVYNDGKRAILGIEKGPAGERVFEDAMRAWGN
jgi:hypothetical protein